MSLRIYNNVAAMNTYRNLSKADKFLSTSLERLSSGLRINRAADDAAGLGISQKMRAQIAGLQMASRNASQATNVVQTAEGGMNEIHNMLTRLRELAVQGASSSVTDTDRAYLNSEFGKLKLEIDRIANSTKYNGSVLLSGNYGNSLSTSGSTAVSTTIGIAAADISINNVSSGTYTITDAGAGTLIMSDGTTTQSVTLLGGGTSSAPGTGQTIIANFSAFGIKIALDDSYAAGELSGTTVLVSGSSGATFQVGADNNAYNQIGFSIGNLKATGSTLGLNDQGVDSQSNAQSAIDYIDTAIDAVNTQRSNLGAVQNRLGYTIANVDNQAENIQASESTIRDADFAVEMSAYTRNQVLVQSATAMLAQANAMPQNVLTLLR